MSKVANGATASKLAGASSGPGLRSSDRSKYSDCAQSISGSNSGSSAGTIGFGGMLWFGLGRKLCVQVFGLKP